nr:LodA/GoxA family CTQ-dependent oxidase [Limobrevibacterium gyesilva]
MPKLWGSGGKPLQNQQLGNNLPDQFLSLTDWQLNHLKYWADGNFEVGVPQKPVSLEQLPLTEQPHALDSSALEPTIGGGFHPGIEFPYLILYRENFAEAFRVNKDIEPGSLAAYMSSPWQGDFWSCNVAWWPTQRPDIVFEYDKKSQTRTYKEWFRGYDANGEPLSSTDGYNQMAYAWSKLGMVLPIKTEDGGFLKDNGETVFVEQERDPALNRPPAKGK